MSIGKILIPISIIIPTRDRAKSLYNILKALVVQISDRDEVLVVDNASNDNTREIVASFARHYRIRYFYESNIGPAFARNFGYGQSKGLGIAFLDDDCIISNRWVNNIKRILLENKNKVIICQGSIKYKFKKQNLLSEIFLLENKIILEKISMTSVGKHNLIHFLNAGNFFLSKKTAVELLPLFDEKNFPFVGEERELALRANRKGTKIKYYSEVEVIHNKERKSLMGTLTKSLQYGRVEGIIEKKYQVNRRVQMLFKNKLSKINWETRAGIEKSIIREISSRSKRRGLLAKIYIYIKNLTFSLGKYYGCLEYKFIS